jgi:EmrB/QacA subfamily drug resistance transporter
MTGRSALVDRDTVYKNRWKILAVLCLSLTVIGLDNLILTVALPSIQSTLSATASELQWTIDGYTLPFGGLLLLMGSLADRLGRKRVLLVGMVVFLGFSLAAAYANSADLLIAARAGMGIGGAMIMPATLSIIRNVFPAEEQAKAVGIWAAAGAIGVPLGPIVGGLLLEHYWWGSVFLVNVPLVALALIAGFLMIPESRAKLVGKLDLVGVVLSAAGLFALVYGLISAPHEGWDDPTTLAVLIGGAVLLGVFALWERRIEHPMLSGELFGNRQFSGSAATVLMVNFGLFAMLFVVTQFLQLVLGYEPFATGVRLLSAITIVVGAGMGIKLVEKAGLKATATLGLILTGVSMVVLAGVETDSRTAPLIALALFGLGMGLAMPACANAILAATPPAQAGVGSAVTDAAIQVGGTLGIAVTGSVLATTYRAALPTESPLPAEVDAVVRDSIGGANLVAEKLGGEGGEQLRRLASDAFVSGLADAMYVGAGVAALGALIALFLLPKVVVDRSREDSEPEQPAVPQKT